jgi:beta-glucanase (GH16 family)
MRSHRRVAALLAGLAFGWLGAPGVALGVPGVAPAVPLGEPRGWSPVFAADFSTPGLPSQCTAYNGQPGGQAAAYYQPDEVQVSGGMLRLGIRRRNFAGRPYTAGGLGCFGLAQRYGRYEYRARVAPAAGVDSYVTLTAADGSESDATLLEVFAARGGADHAQLAHVSNSVGAGVNRKIVTTAVDGFHDYEVEWAPSGTRIRIDGKVVFVDDKASDRYRWPGFSATTGYAETGLPNPDELPAEFLIDWIRVYAYEPGSTAVAGDDSAGSGDSGSQGGPAVASGAAAAPERADGSGWRGVNGLVLLLTAVVGVVCAGFGAYVASHRSRRGRSAHRV